MSNGNVYRAVVLEASEATGNVVVAIPAVAGTSGRFTVSAIARDDVRGVWKVPAVNSVVLVAAEDDNLTSLFLVPSYTYDDTVRAVDIHGDFHGITVVLARNDSIQTIPANAVVHATADGGELVVELADANDIAKMPAFGFSCQTLAPGETGKIAVGGLLTGVNTGALSAGVDLYAATGGLVTINPAGLTVSQIIGRVVEVSSDGSILITVFPPGADGGGDYNGVFSGTIYASAGIIGGSTSGWVIAPNRLESYGAGDKIVLDGQDGQIYIGTYGSGAWASNSTPFYVDKDGQFSLGEDLTWDGNTLDITGTVTAASGSIGGWNIGPSSLFSGASSSRVELSSASTPGGYSIWAGDTVASTAPFSVTNTGVITGSSVNLSGSINATAGSIGGWLISGNSLRSAAGSAGTPIVMDSANGKITIGNTNWADPANAFYVDKNGFFSLGENLTWNPAASVLAVTGNIDTQSGTIANWTIDQYRLYAGTTIGDYLELNSNPADEYRTWAGHPTASVAPFRVTKAGGLVASSASITGNISASTGQVGGWNLGATALTGTNASLDSGGNLTLGSGANVVRLSSTDASYRLWAGGTVASSAPFSVRQDGYVTGSSVNVNIYGDNAVYGKILANNGTMAFGASVSGASHGLYIDANNYWYSTGAFRAGGASNYMQWDTSTLTVVGNVNANSASIGGWTTNSSSFTGSSVGMIPTTWPFFAGSNTASAAPFRVSNTGFVYSSNFVLMNPGSPTTQVANLYASGNYSGLKLGPDNVYSGLLEWSEGDQSVGLYGFDPVSIFEHRAYLTMLPGYLTISGGKANSAHVEPIMVMDSEFGVTSFGGTKVEVPALYINGQKLTINTNDVTINASGGARTLTLPSNGSLNLQANQLTLGSNDLTLTVTGASRTLTISGSYTLDQSVASGANPTFGTPEVTNVVDAAGRYFVRTNTAHGNPQRIQFSGTTDTTSSAGVISVTFDEAFVTTNPTIVACSADGNRIVNVTSRSTSGFSVTIRNASTGALINAGSETFYWIAIGRQS